MSKTSRRTLRLAFLGGGIDSAVGRTHRISVEMDSRFKLVAGCFSRETDINTATAEDYGVDSGRTYSNLEELLTREAGQIDAVAVLTPQHQHLDQVMKCVEQGMPTICEKTLANSSADARRLKKAVEARNGFLAVIYNYTGYPMLRELRNLVRQGELGEITQIHIEMPQDGFARLDAANNPMVPQDWRLQDDSVPTVSLDLGVHLHGIVSFLIDQRPREVVAIQSSFGHFKPIVDNVVCLVRYTNDIECSMWYGKTALGCRNGQRVRIFGTKGGAEWVQEEPEYLYLSDVHGRRWKLDRGDTQIKVANLPRYTRFKAGHPAGFIEAFANYYFDVADALEGFLEKRGQGSPYVFGVDGALEGISLLEAIALSSTSKAWTEVER